MTVTTYTIFGDIFERANVSKIDFFPDPESGELKYKAYFPDHTEEGYAVWILKISSERE